MEKTVFISLPIEDLQTVIIDCVNSCLKNSKQVHSEQPTETDRWFDLSELCNYLPDKLEKPTVYGCVSSNSLPKRQSNDSQNTSQLQTIFQYLSGVSATASMVSDATGVPQKNLCRYKRNLEKAGSLWEVEKKICKKTGFKAWYLTTNPANAPKSYSTQLTLF
ncbi:MAG: hypothetical protein M0Q53_01420 [Prolixibacteraceae bacterium]|jgi:hypothetical protein|nr:hypothetical protein [Prolixibacteraceae bacterium]